MGKALQSDQHTSTGFIINVNNNHWITTVVVICMIFQSHLQPSTNYTILLTIYYRDTQHHCALPLQYVMQKITTFDFVEFWYFSPEGCSKAAKNHCSQADDTFGLTSTNNVLTLCPVALVRASCLTHADHDLSFAKFLQAKNSFLHHIKQALWPNKHVDALAKFFWNLKNHSIHTNKNGDLITLHYISYICHQWHDDLCFQHHHHQ